MAVLWPVLFAGGVFFLLRSMIGGARRWDVLASASRHALCTGVIGWLASSLLPAANAGILPVPETASRTVEILPALAWPVLGCLAVHILGQLSYPRARFLTGQPLDESPRRILNVLPRRLAWTTAAIFAVAAAQIGWLSVLPGFAALPYTSRPDGAGGYVTFGGDGRVPGVELAVYLAAALLVLAAGTFVVLALIARRRPLPGLAPGPDGVLRTIAMNRFLRTAATIAAGFAAIAGNHAARPDPASGITGWINPAGALNLAVLLVMLLWPPPKLTAPQPHPGARAKGNGSRRVPESPRAADLQPVDLRREHPNAL
ncbi:hypothetical protein AB0284_04875 [Pseudarthrobacter phenanthrenivorans]|uniref:hypothetical protein n=1 Tax=Pseudarthrobacter phenanthrenivorans TaxID=361575 RepID=UPI00344FD576